MLCSHLSGRDVSTSTEETKAFQKEFLQTEAVRQLADGNGQVALMSLSLPELCGGFVFGECCHV